MLSLRTRLDQSPLSRLGLNTVWLFSARLLSQVLLFVFTILVAQALGDVGLGQYAFIASVVFIGNVVTTFGIDTILIREIAYARGRAGEPVNETLTTALSVQLVLSLCFMGGIWLVAPRLPNQTAETIPAFYLAALSLIPFAFSTVYSAVLRAYERMDLYLVFNLATVVTMVAGAAVVLARGGGLAAISGTVVLAQCAGALVAAGLTHRSIPDFHWGWQWPDRGTLRELLRQGLTLMAVALLVVVYLRLGTMQLSLLAGDAETGWYSAAFRLVEAFKLAPAAFFGALLPVAARTAYAPRRLRDEATAEPPAAQPWTLAPRRYNMATAGLVLLAIAAAIVVSLLAEPLVELLFGPAFSPAVIALQIMVWSWPVAMMTFRLSFDLVVAGHERSALLAMLVTVVLTGLVTAALIRQSGLVGASLALVAGELIQLAVLAAVTMIGRGAHELTSHL